MSDTVTIDSAPLALTRASLPDDDRALGRVTVGTYIGPHLVLREAMERDVWELVRGIVMPDSPVVVRYVGREADPGIHASLFAIVPASAVPPILRDADEGDAWKGDDTPLAVFLGIAVRYAHDRKHPTDLAAECADHCAAVLGGRVCDVIDRALAGL